MTEPHPQPTELYHVLMKGFEEIERDERLQRAYKRGYEDGRTTHTPAAPATEPKPLRYSGVTVFTPPELSRHDAAIRKAEREHVLDELILMIKRKEGCGYIFMDGPRFFTMIESLRGGATDEGGERR